MVDRLAAPNLPQNFRFLLMPIRWNQGKNRFSDDLFSLVSKDAFGAQVPIGDDSVQVLCHNGIVRRLDDSRQPDCVEEYAIGFVRAPQHIFAEPARIPTSDPQLMRRCTVAECSVRSITGAATLRFPTPYNRTFCFVHKPGTKSRP